MTKIKNKNKKRNKGLNQPYISVCNFVENNLVLHSVRVLINFGHIRRWDQCAVYILYYKVSTDTGLLKI